MTRTFQAQGQSKDKPKETGRFIADLLQQAAALNVVYLTAGFFSFLAFFNLVRVRGQLLRVVGMTERRMLRVLRTHANRASACAIFL